MPAFCLSHCFIVDSASDIAAVAAAANHASSASYWNFACAIALGFHAFWCKGYCLILPVKISANFGVICSFLNEYKYTSIIFDIYVCVCVHHCHLDFVHHVDVFISMLIFYFTVWFMVQIVIPVLMCLWNCRISILDCSLNLLVIWML